MTRIKTAKLAGMALDWAVEGALHGYCRDKVEIFAHQHEQGSYLYSTDWTWGGPIIEREIDVTRKRSKAEEADLAYPNPNFKFKAEIFVDIKGYFCGFGSTALIAAMRCYVGSKLGDEVDVPEELVK